MKAFLIALQFLSRIHLASQDVLAGRRLWPFGPVLSPRRPYHRPFIGGAVRCAVFYFESFGLRRLGRGLLVLLDGGTPCRRIYGYG